ncbi:MAG: hypothetical protein KDC38_21870, partial [Planctomycetes bacterium]|nr:hypothetical protein [Planctomycetota bacterium]
GLEVIGNSVYVLDLAGGTFSVHQLTDTNNDGDALDFGEFVTVADANLWGGADPLGMCGTNNGPFVVDFEVIERGLWAPPGMGVSPFTDVCNGDGGDQMGCTDCPCGNNTAPGTVGGCLNSSGNGSRLGASGDLSVSLPAGSTTDLRFTMTGGPAASTSVLLSGDAVAPTNLANPCFGLNSGALA